ncbi:rhamnulose-1-phosphate aldolase [Ructibacterium gallinarum]|uniref:Rhamnulose-1-phosphate aldolase n=1 Tax=Ructibacterium gallinarum TaxID=2779355 RepID=A0A9D5M624_9FIRM|nr:rhamnulose-1-phosphate aldolase [Ructibacterium gallinarum]MBE5040157.1 rhamnulose-1-phosphate aldolase [Ructibacterium gallinarum]
MYAVKDARFIQEIQKLAANMYRMGWDERNGGNISYLVPEEEVRYYIDSSAVRRHFSMDFDASPVAGKYFVVTGTTKYFKNIEEYPEVNLGLLRISDDGKGYDLLWGYEDGGRPTSEFPSHLMSHIARLKIDPKHRIVMHTHPINTIAMTFVHELSDRAFTRTLWQMITECIVVFPEGVGVLPWMVCGNTEIGEATAAKMKQYRSVIWAQHGIFGTGQDPDEAFGLIETIEKAAEIYMKIAHLPILQNIKDEELKELAKAFQLDYRKDFLD